VVARSEGGGVAIDGGGALQWRRGRGRWRRCENDQERRTNGLRKWMVKACSEAGVEAAACSGARNEGVAVSWPGSWTIGGGGGAMISRATEERERESAGMKNC
jgi:hypothetical protein